MFLSKPYLHVYADNRRRFLENLNGDAALIFSNPHLTRSHDTEFPYRQCSDIHYLSGWEDPDSVILLRPNSDEPFILFVQPKNKEREMRSQTACILHSTKNENANAERKENMYHI